MTTIMTGISPIIYARIAGLLYFIIITSGIFSEVFIRSSLIVAGDASATAGNILASQTFFRIGFVSDSIMLLADVAIAILFYLLFKPVSSLLSLSAAVFRLMQAAILGGNLLNYHAALLLLSGTGYATVFAGNDLNALAMFFLDMHSYGYDLGLIFFGVSNLFLGYLVIKSEYFPVLLGYGLFGAALVYLLGSYIHFIFPRYISLIEPIYIVPLLAELSFCLWLMVKGARVHA